MIVGITGGIGSGKSSVTQILKKYGFEVVQIVSTGIHPERFPYAKKKNLKEKSVEFSFLKFASRTLKLGDTFEVYCRKVNV